MHGVPHTFYDQVLLAKIQDPHCKLMHWVDVYFVS